MTTPQIPDIAGIEKMSALDMNSVRFDKRHTVLTPQVLESLRPSTTTTTDRQPAPDTDSTNFKKKQ